MKKILIATFHNAHNYGAVLQAFALCKTISTLDKKNIVKILNYKNQNISRGYKLFTPVRKNIFKWIPLILNDLKNYNINKKRYLEFEYFIHNYLPLTSSYISEEKIKRDPPSADIYITGSDQVWNPNIVGELSDIYTLNFGNEKIIRISYAASVGNAQIITKYAATFLKKIKCIDFISVREESARLELENLLYKKVTTVLDPSLLLTKEEWDQEIENISTYTNEKYILAYVVEPNNEYVKIVNEMSKRTGLKIIHFGKSNPGYKNVLKSSYTEGPLNFINYIKHAEYVITTSFHATVFSIIYQKNFFIIPHKKTGERVTNLLEKLNIQNRVYYSLSEFINCDYTFETDWNDVANKLCYERRKSIHWLEDALNGRKDDK